MGSIGTILYLIQAGVWADVDEIVSVSGGSTASAAILVHGGDSDDDTITGMRTLFERAVRDRVLPTRTPRRVALSAATLLTFVGLMLVVLGAVGRGPVPMPDNRVVALLIGLSTVPIASLVSRRALAALLTDYLQTLLDPKALLDAYGARRRQHVFCVTGLSSGVPYYFWAGGGTAFGAGGKLSGPRMARDPNAMWGAALQAGYGVVEAVYSSGALPGIARVRSPQPFTADDQSVLAPERELLVDGGVTGIFGDQIAHRWAWSPMDSYRGDQPSTYVVDGGRHIRATGRAANFLGRLSVSVLLSRWLKVSLEATYVNDLIALTDNADTSVIRLCTRRLPIRAEGSQPSLRRRAGPGETRYRDASSSRDSGIRVDVPRRDDRTAMSTRLDALRRDSGTVGLFGLTSRAAALLVVTGFVAAAAGDPGFTDEDITAGLARAGASLGVGAALHKIWIDTSNCPSQ